MVNTASGGTPKHVHAQAAPPGLWTVEQNMTKAQGAIADLQTRVTTIEGEIKQPPPPPPTPLTFSSSITEGESLAGSQLFVAKVLTGSAKQFVFAVDGAVPPGWSSGTETDPPYGGPIDTTKLANGSHLFSIAGTDPTGLGSTVAIHAIVANAVVVPPPPPPPPPASGFYGMGIAGDSLNNIQIGGDNGAPGNRQCEYRFRALQSGLLKTIGFYIVDGTGYGGGTGGSMRVDLYADDGTDAHNPGGPSLANLSYVPGNPVKIGYLPRMTFPNPAAIVAGDLYHLVWVNTDPNPTVNFMSIDLMYYFGAATEPENPRFVDLDWGVKYNDGAGWVTYHAMSPILDLGLDTGVHFGQGYMECWVGRPDAIGGKSMVREVITPSHDVTVSRVHVRVIQKSGTGLTASLNGVTAVFPAYSGGPQWMVVPLATVLKKGVQVALVLSAPSGVYSAYALERGSNYNFDSATYFADGHMEFTTDGSSWGGVIDESGDVATNADLQFYFD